MSASYTEEEKIKILYEQSLKEIRQVVGLLQGIATSISATAGKLKEQETDAHIRSAEALSQATDEIRQAAQAITGLEDGTQTAAAKQVRDILDPLSVYINSLLKKLEDRKDAVTAALNSVQSTQAKWAENMTLVIGATALALLITAGSTFYAGNVSAQKEIQQKAEWLDTPDGRYALQLRDAGSLKALAMCNAGSFDNDWQKSKDGRVCFPNPTNGKVIGWHIVP